ncbi:MAG TPA: lysylphosphatidylglycerol synthase transmembrane domain-containing protein [Vicinamibacterales bacterium]|jgi:hypothetical protein
MGSPPTPARIRRISFIVAAALAAVLLWLSLRGIDWREVKRIVSNASPGLLAISAACASITLFLRAVRWRVLLNAEGSIGVPAVFWATAAGLFGNNFLPARAGELVRTVIVSTRSGLGNVYVLATALSERVADMLVLVIVSAAVLLTLPSPPGWMARTATPIAMAGLIGASAIAVLPLCESFVRRAIERLPLPDRLRLPLTHAIESGMRGVRAFHDVRRLSIFLGLTFVIWWLDAIGTVICASALDLRIPTAVAFLLIAGLGVGSALPSTPGYVGIYQFVAVSVLTPFGFSRTDAIAYILVAQALFFVVIGFWGSIGLWRQRHPHSG